GAGVGGGAGAGPDPGPSRVRGPGARGVVRGGGGRGVGGPGVSGGGNRAAFADEVFQPGGAGAAEGPVVTGPVQDGHSQLGGRDLVAPAVTRRGQRGQGIAERLGQGHAVGVAL